MSFHNKKSKRQNEFSKIQILKVILVMRMRLKRALRARNIFIISCILEK